MDITDLAGVAVNKLGIRGIDWVALAQKGRGSVWVRDYMTDYMMPAQVQMNAVIGTLAGDPATFNKNYAEANGAVADIASSLSSLAGVNIDLTKMTFQASGEAIRTLISHAYAAATFGARTHYDETIHHSGISDAEIATHANLCVAMMNTIVILDKLGVYATYQLKHPGMSGLGFLPAVAWVAIAVVAICALAYVVLNYLSLSKTNAIVSTMCTNAQASGDVATTQQCVNTLSDSMRKAGTAVPDALGAAFKAVLPYALGALAIYALFLSAPAIIKAVTTKAA